MTNAPKPSHGKRFQKPGAHVGFEAFKDSSSDPAWDTGRTVAVAVFFASSISRCSAASRASEEFIVTIGSLIIGEEEKM